MLIPKYHTRSPPPSDSSSQSACVISVEGVGLEEAGHDPADHGHVDAIADARPPLLVAQTGGPGEGGREARDGEDLIRVKATQPVHTTNVP